MTMHNKQLAAYCEGNTMKHDLKNMSKDRRYLLALCAQAVRNMCWADVLNISVRATQYDEQAWFCELFRDGKKDDRPGLLVARNNDKKYVERVVSGCWQLPDATKFIFEDSIDERP